MAEMRCARLVEAGKPLVLSDDSIPDTPARGLVVRTSFAGICHSDIHMQDDAIPLGGEHVFTFSSGPNYNFPLIPGHEVSGVVHSIGSDAGDTGLKIGDKVMVYPWVGCCSNECGFYRSGNSHRCTKWTKTIGLGAPGGFATFVPVPETKLAIKVPENVSMETAAFLPCSGITAYNAVLLAKPNIDLVAACRGKASLLIIGAGGLGMWCVQLAKAVLPDTTIIVADISEEKLENAKKHGADKTVLWNDDEEASIIARTRQAGNEDGIDAAIDFVNIAKTASRANSCLGKGGVLVCVGLFGGAMPLSLPLVVMQMRSIIGTTVGSLQSLHELVKLVSEKQIKSPPKEYVKLEDVNDALDRLRQGKVNGRGIIRFDHTQKL